MSLSLNGWSYGQIKITRDISDVPTDVFVDLPMTNYGSGLEEITEFKGINHETIALDMDNPDIIDLQGAKGYKLNWVFHYDDFIEGEDLYNFKKIIDAWRNGDTMILTPRVDVPERSFRVNLVNENLTIMLRRGGSAAKYHKGVLFTFRSRSLEQDIKWFLQPEPNTNFIVAINEYQISV